MSAFRAGHDQRPTELSLAHRATGPVKQSIIDRVAETAAHRAVSVEHGVAGAADQRAVLAARHVRGLDVAFQTDGPRVTARPVVT